MKLLFHLFICSSSLIRSVQLKYFTRLMTSCKLFPDAYTIAKFLLFVTTHIMLHSHTNSRKWSPNAYRSSPLLAINKGPGSLRSSIRLHVSPVRSRNVVLQHDQEYNAQQRQRIRIKGKNSVDDKVQYSQVGCLKARSLAQQETFPLVDKWRIAGMTHIKFVRPTLRQHPYCYTHSENNSLIY